MARAIQAPAGQLSRRGFLALASGAAGLWLGRARARPSEPDGGGGHGVSLRLPEATRNGAKVPIVAEATCPPQGDHRVSLRVVNPSDPVASKGTFHFTPASGAAYVAFQARMQGGVSEVAVSAECSCHARRDVRRRIEIPESAGGCLGDPRLPRPGYVDIRSPELRIAELVARGRIRAGDVIHPQLKIRHPNRTGLAARDGSWVAASPPIHLREMTVWFRGERVSRFELTPALADDPFIEFALLASGEGTLEVHLTNNLGQRFEAAHEIRFA